MRTDDTNKDYILEGQNKNIHSIISKFSDFKDIRVLLKISFSLDEIFLTVLCAQICGYISFREYEHYGNLKIDFLRNFLPFQNGIPSHQTFKDVLAIFDPQELERKFRQWIKEIISSREEAETKGSFEDDQGLCNEPDTIAIDGKANRGLRKRSEDDRQLTVLGAMSSKHGLLMGQETVDEKSNEITAIPKLLDSLDIKGHIVSIDAVGCQTEITHKVRSRGGDYILALKGNQEGLHEVAKDFFNKKDNLEACLVHEMSNGGHGRIENRKCYVISGLTFHDSFNKWKDLNTLVMLESSRIIKGKEEKEARYFISSLPPNPFRIMSSIRFHWGIENKGHWVLDVIFGEDDRIIWDRNIAKNESTIRRIALNLLKMYQGSDRPTLKSRKVAIKTMRKNLLADDEGMKFLLLNL